MKQNELRGTQVSLSQAQQKMLILDIASRFFAPYAVRVRVTEEEEKDAMQSSFQQAHLFVEQFGKYITSIRCPQCRQPWFQNFEAIRGCDECCKKEKEAECV